MEKIHIKENVGVLVNNLCNMTCSHCTGLALYDFLGTFKWKDHEHRYRKWAELVDIDAFSIAGGEPYLHPELELWFDNMRELWPNALLEVYTNGTRLSKKIELTRKMMRDGNAHVIVSCHDENTFDSMHETVLEILSPWEGSYTKTEAPGKKFESWKKIRYYVDDKVIISIQLVTEMAPPYHKKIENGILYFEMDGDQEASHARCTWKDNYTFQHGLLYKCQPVVNYPEAVKQVRYEEAAKEILDKYQACDPFSDIDTIKKFIDDLPNSIPVCKLCAFDKQEGVLSLSRQVVLDPDKKKKMRQFKMHLVKD